MTEDAALQQAVARVFNGRNLKTIGVAVSGGSDSLALLYLLTGWSSVSGVPIRAVTVDHGLRDASRDEAFGVGEICAGLGVAHDILVWQGWNGAGNLQDQARRARLRLMAGWAVQRGVGTVALGHTADDQAETFVMRLARGSGVDGLTGMSVWRAAEGVNWVRPLLPLRRSVLQAYLARRGAVWVDDPSNDNDRFARVKVRKALAVLEALGIGAEALADTAQRMDTAQQVLSVTAEDAARRIARIHSGDVVIDSAALAALLPETRRRILAHTLAWVASADYRPRQADLARVEGMVAAGESCTLHGCQITVTADQVRIAREYQAVRDIVSPVGQDWDNRWRVSGPKSNGLRIGPLGADGLAGCADWRDTGLPRASLLASPAVWFGSAVVAAPLAGGARGWTARLVRGDDSYYTSLLSH